MHRLTHWIINPLIVHSFGRSFPAFCVVSIAHYQYDALPPAKPIGTLLKEPNMKPFNSSNQPVPAVLAVGRLMIAILFLASAVVKLMAPAATVAFIASSGLPFAMLGLVNAVCVEVGGGLMLACGIKTRGVAIGLAIFSIVTGLVFHHDLGNQMQLMEFLKNIAIAGGLLHIAAFEESDEGIQNAAPEKRWKY